MERTLGNIKTSFTNLGFLEKKNGIESYSGLQSPTHFMELFFTAIVENSCIFDDRNKKLYIPWNDASLFIEINLNDISIKGTYNNDSIKTGLIADCGIFNKTKDWLKQCKWTI